MNKVEQEEGREGKYDMYQETVLYQGKPEAKQQTFRHSTAIILSA